MSKDRIVRFILKPGRKLSAKQQAELEALAKKPAAEIDFSDIPPLDDDFFCNAIRNPWYCPPQQRVTISLDADVLAWLKSAGKGYQTRLNAMLREAMARDLAGSDAPK